MSFDLSSGWSGTGAVLRRRLSDGVSDAEQILTGIEQLTTKYSSMPEVRAFALSLMPRNMGNDDQNTQLRAIGDFVAKDMFYVRDPAGVEYFISVPKMIREYGRTGRIYADCDDHVLMFNTLLKSLGFHVRAVAAKITNSGYFDHVFSEYELNGRTGFFDGCQKSSPYEDKQGEMMAVVPLVP
ncbi:hypothetical protein EBZ80_07040 [bacterium]|nr:hypothetical protein [bacterium]